MIPALSAALAREPKDVRAEGGRGPAAIGTAAAVPPLLVAAADADEDVRADALRGLGAIGDARATRADRGGARRSAAHDPRRRHHGMCRRLHHPETIERLADIAIHERNPAVALAARTTLAAIRAKGATEDQAVRSAVDRRRPAALPTGASADERALAAIFCRRPRRTPAGIPALVAVLGRASPPLQRQVTWRLGARVTRERVGALRRFSSRRIPMVRAYAYDALVKLRDHGVDAAGAAVAAYAGPKPFGPLAPPEP